MSHLDTAYKIGAAQAAQDFQVELQKQAYQPGSMAPPAAPTAAVGSPAAAVRGTVMSGASNASRGAAKGIQVPTGGSGARPTQALGGAPARPM